jgi:arylsulfatase A-like enzyme
MRKPNIIILVIDTLREDYSSGLEALRELGFVKYENAIAPAPWTLPSHVSLITGMYPSQHGIHEAYGVYVDRELRELSTQRLSTLNHGIIGELMDEGYSTYIVSANPFLSPLFGFTKFTENLITGYIYVSFRSYEEYKDHEELSLIVKDHGYIDTALKFIKERNLRMLNKAIKFFIKGRVTRLATKLGVYDPTMEKGSRIIMDFLSKRKLGEPFFLFINIMEAHGPYVPKDLDEQLSFNAYFNAVFMGKLSDEAVRIWQSNYPRHAIYATKSAVKIIKVLRRYLDDSLVIIAADHGELLGDGGIFHGYFLKDGLLRVPLWIKWPSWIKPQKWEGQFVSLIQVPSIIRAVINNKEPKVGTDIAIAESFGSTLPSTFSKRYSELPSEIITRVFTHRIKIYTKKGIVTYNINMDKFEEIKGDDKLKAITKDIITSLIY